MLFLISDIPHLLLSLKRLASTFGLPLRVYVFTNSYIFRLFIEYIKVTFGCIL